MRAATLFSFLLFCAGTVQSQTVFLEYADPFGDGTALLGPAQIEVDLWLDFPPPGLQTGGAVNITYDIGRTALNRIDLVLPPCPDPGGPCVIPGTDDGAGTITGLTIEAPPGAAIVGLQQVAVLLFDSLNLGPANFAVEENPALPFGVPVTYNSVIVDIIDAETCTSGSLPQGFEVAFGLPTGWDSVPVGPPTTGQKGGLGLPEWRSTAEQGFCDFAQPGTQSGDNVTGGDGEAACLQGQVTKGDPLPVGEGPALCTTTPLDLLGAMTPVLELNANFQPAGLGGEFKVVGGPVPPDPLSLETYEVLFHTVNPLGAFASLPGELLVVPLPSQSPYYVCVIVNGEFAYAEVDQCISCALSCGGSPDSDGDGVADNIDNCVDDFNPDQRDTDGDGYGNICDGDFDDNCFVNFVDLATMQADFFVAGDLDTDLNGDGTTNFSDLSILQDLFFLPPGPSGQLTSCNAPQRASRAPDCGFE